MTKRQIGVVGSYADEEGGLYTYRLDATDGALHALDTAPASKTAFVTRHPEDPYVYTAGRTGGGIVAAFHADPETGAVTSLNERSSGGAAPGYVSVDATGRYCFVANCDGHTVAMLPIEADGHLGPVVDSVDHPPAGVGGDGPTRSDGSPVEPHPHAVVPGPENRFVYVPDLALDLLSVYRIDVERGRIAPAATGSVALALDSGPRHLAFHPDGRDAYLINEFASTVTVFERDAERGGMSKVQTVDTLPEQYEGENKCADVHVHPSGEWVYGSNRGHDSIAVFAVAGGNGHLRPVAHESTRGGWPRDFELDRSGRYLFAENMHSDDVVTFAVDPETGTLEPTGAEVAVPEPISMTTIAGR